MLQQQIYHLTYLGQNGYHNMKTPSEYAKEWRKQNPEKVREGNKAYRTYTENVFIK